MAYHQSEPIVCEQVFSKNALGFLWSKRDELDPGQASLLDSLYKGRKKGSIEGSFISEYRLPATGAGKLGFGRLYGTKGSMEKLERECRGTLCKQFYHDIDIVNCHPVLLHQFAKRYYDKDLVEVEKYCDNREEYLKLISENREEAKTAVITIMYGGKNAFPFLKEFADEVRSFTKTVMADEKYKELLAYVKRQDGNVYGTFLSLVLQTEERRVMMAMRKSFMNREMSVDVLAYDGVMVRKDPIKLVSKDILREVEQESMEQTGYKIQLTDKEMDSYEVPDEKVEIAPKITREMYEERKMLFEENHFYYRPGNSIAEVYQNQLSFYEIPHAKICMNSFDFKHSNALKDRTSFIDLWLADDKRREIHTIDQKPSDDPTVFSPPTVFRYSTFKEEADEKAVELFLDLAKETAGGSEPILEYKLNWYAHLIQKPFENPKTALIFTGKKGCGKDTEGDLLMEWIVGDMYSHNYTSTTQFWDKHDCDRLNKLFIKLEEASGYVNRKNVGDMKARITSRTNTVNPKGKGSITSANYNRYMMNSNEGDPVKTEEGERRFLTIACGSNWVGDRDKWTLIRKILFCPSGARAIGEYLASRDISQWDPRLFPENEYQDDLINAERSPEDYFMDSINKGRMMSGSEIWNAYQSYCNEKSLNGITNQTAFGRALLTYIRDGVLKKDRKTRGIVYIKA